MYISGYSDLSISRAGIKPSFVPAPGFGAHFRLERDVSPLFPYIHADLPYTRYFENPVHIQFAMEDVLCTLYPHEALAGPFSDKAQAERFARRLIAFLNDLHDRKDTLTPDHKTVRPISAMDVLKLLPRTNCRKCGFATCLAFAATLSKGWTSPGECPGFETPISERAVYPVYDSEGNLTSTVAIEVDTGSDKPGSRGREAGSEDKGDGQQRRISLQEDSPVGIRTGLTDRELQVLRLVAEGSTNTEISDRLSISPHTVKSHVVHIFNKLGVNDRTQAAVWAARHNII